MSKHTPWRVANVGPEPKEIWVCTVDMPPIFICECEDENIAEQIMSNHNTHDELVAMVRRLRDNYERALKHQTADTGCLDDADALLEKVS